MAVYRKSGTAETGWSQGLQELIVTDSDTDKRVECAGTRPRPGCADNKQVLVTSTQV